ncbi:selenium binding protein [Sporosarcina sp. P17b]|uniref:selenium binding protein n=1 Tax=Sporosarcina sp. P17b TaxID=2048260 RepID=UPI000C164480|nr:selenium binding protein [Sporosarcina sp. P17b]PIC73712.1 selenium binding protein [Sporosarcina sp. P17b]
MYEKYSRQALPSKEYRALLGSAICVFNSNNSFVIENILRCDGDEKYNWYELIDKVSGRLSDPIKETITRHSDDTIANLFSNLVNMRNRIVHSFQITAETGEQMLATKTKTGQQFRINENYLFDFIKKNEELSVLLHNFRGY